VTGPPPSTAAPRTQLAWQRTGLLLLALAALLLKVGESHHAPLELAAAAVALLTAVAALGPLPRLVAADPSRRSVILATATVAVLVVDVLAVAGALID
jgi:putative membrane protein